MKLSNSQLNKLKLEIKNSTDVTLNLSSNLIGNSNDDTNFLLNSLSNNTQVLRLCKVFANGSVDKIKI